MRAAKIRLAALAMLVMLGCNLPTRIVDQAVTEVFDDVFATQTAIAGAATSPSLPTEPPTPTPAATATAVPADDPPTPPAATVSVAPTEPSEPEVYIADDFSDIENPLWTPDEIYSDETTRIEVVDGQLLLFAGYIDDGTTSGIATVAYFDIPENFAFSVDMRFMPGSEAMNDAGIMFKLDANGFDYEFTLSPNGEFAIFSYTGEFIPLVDYTFSDHVQTGDDAINQLAVVYENGHMTFLINGFVVDEIDDSSLSGDRIGLIIYNLGESDFGVYFDNVLVTDPASYFENPPELP